LQDKDLQAKQSVTSNNNVTDKSSHKYNKNNNVSDVTDRKGGAYKKDEYSEEMARLEGYQTKAPF
jgi:hypothetical protein